MKNYFTTLTENIISQPAIVWIAIIGLILLGGIVLYLKKESFTPRMLSTGALCVALSFILSLFTVFKLMNGGSVTPASMLPILVYAWMFGAPAGIAAGLVHGLLQIIQGAYIVHPIQFLFDYILPFALLGAAGFFKKNLLVGIAIGCLLRFLCHFVSGFIFWGEYAPAGQTPWLYSFLYNGSYMLPETIICLVVASIPALNKAITRLKLSNAIK